MLQYLVHILASFFLNQLNIFELIATLMCLENISKCFHSNSNDLIILIKAQAGIDDDMNHLIRSRYIADEFDKERTREVAALLANPANCIAILSS